MPYTCPVCNNDDYEEIDGHFFCTECQTQSQELIVQEVSADIDVNYRHEVKVSDASTHSSTKKKKVDLGRPWTIYEAYQIIILAQADGLISQGASENLKDVVFTIWANYLAKLGVAFCKKEKLVPDIVTKTKFGRLRELHRGTLNNPLNRRKRSITTELNTLPSKAVKASHLETEEFYEQDKPVDEHYDNIVFLEGSDDDGFGMSHMSRKRMAVSSPEWMNMRKTLAICYIGLMFTNPNILPCDVVRFVYESKVPFLSVTHLLPSDMVLSASDTALFETGRLDTSTFIVEINRLLAHLKLDKMPSADLEIIIPRFVSELCLPDEFVSFSYHLMEKIPFMWHHNKKTCYAKQEVLAMGYIVLAMMVALGLDDSTEIKLSSYSKKLQDLLRPKIGLFVWSDWKKFMTQKRADEFCANRELTSDISKSKLQHLDQLLECYYKTESDKRRHTTWRAINRHKRPVRCYQAEFRNSLRKPLEIASDRFKSEGSSKQDAACESKEDWAVKGQGFHLCTMSHIVNISLFKRQVGHMSPEHNTRLEKLMMKYSLPRTEVLQYKLVKDDESLVPHRHESYLWLLSLASDVVNCSVTELDKLVVHLFNYLVTHSSGTVKSGIVCSQNGQFRASKKSLKKIPFTSTC